MVGLGIPQLGWGHHGWVEDAMIGLRIPHYELGTPQLGWGRHD